MTSPNPAYQRAQMMDARHPRALFPATVSTDSRLTIGILALQGDVREHSLALEAAGARPSPYAAPPTWAMLLVTGSTVW